MVSATFLSTAYGLNINSSIALPELMPSATPEDAKAADIVVTVGRPIEPDLAGSGAFDYQVGLLQSCLVWRSVGRFLLREGREVLIEPSPHVAEHTLRAFLLGPVLAILLYQRGFLVLHASAAALRNAKGEWNAVGFLGDSGEGKSTMVAQLHERGHRIICDDVIAIPTSSALPPQSKKPEEKDLPVIFPGFPQLRLWPQSLAALGRDYQELPLLPHHPQRRIFRAVEGFKMAGLPLRRLYVLKSGDSMAILPVSPAHAVMQLARHSYCAGSLPDDDIAAHFQQCGAIANCVPLNILQRPRDLARLIDVATIIENEAASPT